MVLIIYNIILLSLDCILELHRKDKCSYANFDANHSDEISGVYYMNGCGQSDENHPNDSSELRT